LLSWILLIYIIVNVGVLGNLNIDEATLYLVICAVSGFSMCHLIYNVIDELKEILNINCFIISRPLREKGKAQ
jgi:hypothetical protein